MVGYLKSQLVVAISGHAMSRNGVNHPFDPFHRWVWTINCFMTPTRNHSLFGIVALAVLSLCAGCGGSEVAASKASANPDQAPPQDNTAIRIVKPLPGTSLEPGATFDVVVEVPHGFTFRDGLYIGFQGDGRSFESAPYSATFTVPSAIAGRVTVNTMGVLKDGTPVGATIDVDVKPTTELAAIEFMFKELVMFFSRPQRTVELVGLYRDGRRGQLHPTVPITMAMDDATVATVDNSGRVVAKAPGETILRATAGGHMATLPIIVRAED